MTSFVHGIRPATAKFRTESTLDAASWIIAFKLLAVVGLALTVSFVVLTTPRGSANADAIDSRNATGKYRIDIQFQIMVGVVRNYYYFCHGPVGVADGCQVVNSQINSTFITIDSYVILSQRGGAWGY
jgi:hypothetical protein